MNGTKKYYLINEVEVFLNLLESVSRMRKTKVFLLGNAGNLVTNPYFIYFNLSLPNNSDIRTFKNGLILLQYMKNEEYRKEKAKSLIGQLTAGTNYEKYAYQNQDTHINTNFIEHKKASSHFDFAFTYNSITFGVWLDFKEGKIYVSHDYNKDSNNIFALTTKDHNENTLLMKSINRYQCFRKFLDNYELGNVRFESQEIKSIFNDIISKILIYK